MHIWERLRIVCVVVLIFPYVPINVSKFCPYDLELSPDLYVWFSCFWCPWISEEDRLIILFSVLILIKLNLFLQKISPSHWCFLLNSVRKQTVQEQSYKILKETYHLSARLVVHIVSGVLQSKLQCLPSTLTGTESRFAFNPSTSCHYYLQP